MLQCLACKGKLIESEFVEYKDRIYSASSKQAECPYCGTPYSPLRIAQKDFSLPEHAACARDELATELHGEFAVLNFGRQQ